MKRFNNKIISMSVIGLMSSLFVGGVAFAGGTPSIYLTPTLGSYQVGAIISVSVRENSGAAPVDKALVNVDYPVSLLQYQAVDSSTSAFDHELVEGSDGNGEVWVRRSNSSNLTGDQLVGIITFKVIGVGVSNVTVAVGSDTIDSNGNYQNSGFGGASYNLVAAPTPTPVPATPRTATPKPVVAAKTPSPTPSVASATATPKAVALSSPASVRTQSKTTSAPSPAASSSAEAGSTILGMTKTAATLSAGAIVLILMLIFGLLFWFRSKRT